jgi:uncharacterized membrane protein
MKYRPSNVTLQYILPILFFIILFSMALLKYWSLHSSVLDLGLFTFQFYQIGNEREYGNLFSSHLYGFMLPISFIVSFVSDTTGPISLLFLQSGLLALPIFWLYKYHGRIVALSYLLFFPVWFNALFDFHFDFLSVPLLVAFYLFTQSRSYLLAVVSAILLSLVKEIYALQTIMCGVYILKICVENKLRIKTFSCGLGLIIFGIGYYLFATDFLIPLYTPSGMFGAKLGAFSYMGTDINSMLLYIVNNIVEIIDEIFTNSGKLIYLVALFGALGFVPLFKLSPLIVALPILAISLLSKHEGYYGLGHQYTAGLIAPMIFAFAGGLPRVQIIWNKVGFSAKWLLPVLLTGMITAHIALAPSPIGRLFWSEKVWSYSYQAYIPTEREKMIKQAIVDFIPTEPDLVVSIQNTVNWEPLVQKHHFLIFPQGITKSQDVPTFGNKLWAPELNQKSIMADYVVLDLNRPWFLLDKGCDWLLGKCSNNKVAREYLEWVDKTKSKMQVIFEKDNFFIFKRIKKSGQ